MLLRKRPKHFARQLETELKVDVIDGFAQIR